MLYGNVCIRHSQTALINAIGSELNVCGNISQSLVMKMLDVEFIRIPKIRVRHLCFSLDGQE